MKVLTAYDVARSILEVESFRFGSDSDRAARVLRELADRLEAGKAAVVEVISGQEAKKDDYAISTFVIRYAEKGEPT